MLSIYSSKWVYQISFSYSKCLGNMGYLKHFSDFIKLLDVNVVVDHLIGEFLLDKILHDWSQLLARTTPWCWALSYNWNLAIYNWIPLFHWFKLLDVFSFFGLLSFSTTFFFSWKESLMAIWEQKIPDISIVKRDIAHLYAGRY